MQPLIETTAAPDPKDRETILGLLMAHAHAAAGPSKLTPLAILLRDPQSGAVLGGLWGRSIYDWLIIELLAVPESLRGQGLGTKLMAEAEAVARARDCIGIWLDTYEFQAKGFYEKLGYAQFGEIADHPRGQRRYLVQKRL